MIATETRKITDAARSQSGEYLRAETEAICNAIESAAHLGHDSITTSKTDTVIRQRLTGLGYTVKYTTDHREGDYLTVSW